MRGMPRQFLFGLAVLASLAIVPHAAGQAAPQTQAPAANAKPNDYTADSSWLCRPGRKGDACDIDLATTVVAANGTLTRETWAADPKPAIDCFYVYPTISTDPGVNSDMTPDPAELNVVAQQFARFGSKCRVFAPSYRQVTLAGLRQRDGQRAGGFGLGTGLAYDDVRDAWNSYLQRDNQGRGVALIGHSQGSFVLIELIKKEIEGKPVQKRIVSAILLGATVEVPTGKDVGGTFQQMPLCRAASQTGCVITYGSYRSTVPPPESALFGRTTTAGDVGRLHEPREPEGRRAGAPALVSLGGWQDRHRHDADQAVGHARRAHRHAVGEHARPADRAVHHQSARHVSRGDGQRRPERSPRRRHRRRPGPAGQTDPQLGPAPGGRQHLDGQPARHVGQQARAYSGRQ